MAFFCKETVALHPESGIPLHYIASLFAGRNEPGAGMLQVLEAAASVRHEVHPD